MPTEPLVVLFEDAHCLAAAKPAGLLTQGRPADGPTLEDLVRHHIDPADPKSVYLGTVHRLDRPVSGVVLWAKTPKAARRLARQFETRSAAKHYWAVVEGDARSLAGQDVWDDMLRESDGPRVTASADSAKTGTRRAITRFQVAQALKLPAGTSWLRLWPETGRKHQLRAQSAARGCPILGDSLYGAARGFPRGIALHARALRVVHPVLGTPLTWVAPLPVAWAEAGIELPETPAFELKTR